MNTAILRKPLNTLTVNDLNEIGMVADSLFARLLRPFMVSHFEYQFSVPKTIRKAIKTGMPVIQYEKVEKKHRKSKIIIAMSLSGIDRCFGCGLLRLLAEMKRCIDYKLFIYTDTCVEAEFTKDFFLANDHRLAWNNVVAPVAWLHLDQLLENCQSREEEQILFIDSIGGGDSEWYTRADKEVMAQVVESQAKYVGNRWQQAREFLNGRYELIDQIPESILPKNFKAIIDHNVNTRWVESPALRDYLYRWIFNPKFGDVIHGERPNDDRYHGNFYMALAVEKLRERFKKIHFLTPSLNYGQNLFDWLVNRGFVDYHHRADTLEGFAEMLVNIVYGRETNRITVAEIKFSNYVMVNKPDDDDEGENHSEISMSSIPCFAKIPDRTDCLPNETTKAYHRGRGKDYVTEKDSPYSELSLRSARECLNCFDNISWEVSSSWTEYSQLQKAKEVIDLIANCSCVPVSNMVGVSIVAKTERLPVEEILGRINFIGTTEKPLRTHVHDFFKMADSVYERQISAVPLSAVTWCSVPKFHCEKLAISVRPSENEKRADVFHELSHYLEHVAPEIGVYTNSMLDILTGEFEINKVVRVGQECSRKPLPGNKDWIQPYAGKWYRRVTPQLPNPTELFSVHCEYFTEPKALAALMAHDPLMAKMVTFILMGGPVALMKSAQKNKKRVLEEEIEQKEIKSQALSVKNTTRTKKDVEVKSVKNVQEQKSFGL